MNPETITKMKAELSAQAIETMNELPALELPSPGRPVSDFATEIGRMLASKGIYAREGLTFRINPNKMSMEPVDEQWLRTWVEMHVVPFRTTKERDGERFKLKHTMSLDTARAVVVSQQFLDELPELRRYVPVRMPVMRGDGRIELLPTGYDEETRTLTEPSGCEFATDMTTKEANAVIAEVFEEFPFCDNRSRAVAIAAMFTVFGTGLLPWGAVLPGFLYLANAEGAGKTTVAQVAGIPYGVFEVRPGPASNEEMAKRLLTLIVSGKRLCLLDNLRGRLDFSSLETYMTAPRYCDRILGFSKEFEGDADAVLLFTGNGVEITPDMRRRVLFVELTISELRPEERRFKRRLDAPAMRKLQPRLLGAMWGLVRAWDEAGRPASSIENSSFPAWTDVIAGIVEHAGFGCPTSLASLRDGGDPDAREIEALGHNLDPADAPRSFTELVDVCRDLGLFSQFTEDREPDGEMTKAARSKLAIILKRYDTRIIATGKRFVLIGAGRNRRYRVEEEGPTPQQAPDNQLDGFLI